MGWFDWMKRGGEEGLEKGMTSGGIGSLPGKYDDATKRDQGFIEKLGLVGDNAGQFGQDSQGQFRSLGREATGERDYLRNIARGNESVSRMQLAQALQQNQAAQQSMAAGARPGNAAMAARGAAMNAGRQGAGLAGQQAIAGIQERQAAQQQLAQMLMQQRQQELGGVQTGYGTQVGAFGTALGGAMGSPTGTEKLLDLIMRGGEAIGGAG
jgi:hypothetical protein